MAPAVFLHCIAVSGFALVPFQLIAPSFGEPASKALFEVANRSRRRSAKHKSSSSDLPAIWLKKLERH